MGKKAIVIVAVSVTTLVILFAPIIPIDETFTEIETYNRPLRYGVISSKDREIWNTREGYGFLPIGGITHTSVVVIENRDEHGGTFKVSHCWEDEFGAYSKKEFSSEQYLALGEVGNFNASFIEAWKSGCNYEFSGYKISAPSIQDERMVTKHKTHHKSIIEIISVGNGLVDGVFLQKLLPYIALALTLTVILFGSTYLEKKTRI